ncbi:APC family permease [Thiomicrorhabdus lithotrophica]|uniref:Amino acid permease n=1 Tax=Thiomicrorhabdus lithotrophica TaxID=2949997 RepID=A0ABY8C747_9GAMM|nr:amino acid permease [Thiomicrorhabdus lithotrophica]WEJ61784.1 amino acid permease [Thiomicrorhabdus lithotrophica]
MENNTPLKRTLSLPQMILYGLGTTIGAGIYALVGELAGISGYLAPAAFLFAALLAGLTALSFAELSCRYPRAAGAALYTQQGFHSHKLTIIVGLLVITAGLVSSAALINGFSGYLNHITTLDRSTSIIIVSLFLIGIAVYGIAESIFLASLITVIEVGGLVWIIFVGHDALNQLPEIGSYMIPDFTLASFGVIFAGALLAFYAFIGFEDMVDVAEEVENVKRNLPLAILFTLGITTLLYMLIMVIAVASMPPEELAQSKAPLATLFTFHTGQPATIISMIGMLAIINGSLIQIIMASRVIYGLSSRHQLPAVLSYVNPKTQTPIIATVLAGLVVLLLALIGHLSTLAEITSFIMLMVFSLVNLALWRIKRHEPDPEDCIIFPQWISLLAFLVSSGFVILEITKAII